MSRAIRLHPEFGRCDGCHFDAELWCGLCTSCWAAIYAPPRPRRRSWLHELEGLTRWVDRHLEAADAWQGWPALLGLASFCFLVGLFMSGGTR